MFLFYIYYVLLLLLLLLLLSFVRFFVSKALRKIQILAGSQKN